MPELSFVPTKYNILSMSMGSANLGDLSLIRMQSDPVRGHGTLQHHLELSTAPWIKLPAQGRMVYTPAGSTFKYSFSKGVSRSFFDHIYTLLIHDKPVTVEVGYSGEEFFPFTSPNGPGKKVERDVDYVRFKTGEESVGEMENVNDILKRLS